MPSQRRRSQRLSQASRRPIPKLHLPPPLSLDPLLSPLLTPFPLHSIAQVKRLPTDATFHLLAVVMSIGDVISFVSKRGQGMERCPISLGDDSGRYFELMTWNAQMEWRRDLHLGDVVVCRHVKVSRWRTTTTKAMTTYATTLCCLHSTAKEKAKEAEEREGKTEERKEEEEGRTTHRGRSHPLLSCLPPEWLLSRVEKLVQWVKSEQGGFLYLHSLTAPVKTLLHDVAPLQPSPSSLDPASFPLLPVRDLLSPTLPSACYRVRCRIHRVRFPSLPFFSPSPALAVGDIPPWSSLTSLVYRGCPHCTRELHEDRNGVYSSVCQGCLALDDSRIHSSDEVVVRGGREGWFYRPFHILVRDDGVGGDDEGSVSGNDGAKDGVWLTVHHAVAIRLFANLPASIWVEEPLHTPLEESQAPATEEGGGGRGEGEGGRRRSKRLRTTVQPKPLPEEDSAMTEEMAEVNSAGEKAQAFCKGRVDEAVLSRFCLHSRCQWMALLCSAVSGEVGEGGGGLTCDWSMFLDVRLNVDDNEEMESRRIALLGCSTLND